jgi:C1A family cysteine protease
LEEENSRMSTFHKLTLGLLTALTLATAAGCGQPNKVLPALAGSEAQTGTYTSHGVTYKLGYDYVRYQKLFKHKAPKSNQILDSVRPAQVDLRDEQGPVYGQGALGSCTAFAITKGLHEHLRRKNGEHVAPLSALFGYYETRRVAGHNVFKDTGGTIVEGMKALQLSGSAPDALWPYDIAKFHIMPTVEAYMAAQDFKVKQTTQLAGLEDVKAALARGQSVAFGFVSVGKIMSPDANGVMPMPQPGDPIHGGHAMLAVGYDDTKQHLIVRNSWGDKWGIAGFAYMPYAFFTTTPHAMDFWTAI